MVDPQLFKGLIFYFEIKLQGEDAHDTFNDMIINHGGKVLKKLEKRVTHLVWSGGNIKTL